MAGGGLASATARPGLEGAAGGPDGLGVLAALGVGVGAGPVASRWLGVGALVDERSERLAVAASGEAQAGVELADGGQEVAARARGDEPRVAMLGCTAPASRRRAAGRAARPASRGSRPRTGRLLRPLVVSGSCRSAPGRAARGSRRGCRPRPGPAPDRDRYGASSWPRVCRRGGARRWYRCAQLGAVRRGSRTRRTSLTPLRMHVLVDTYAGWTGFLPRRRCVPRVAGCPPDARGASGGVRPDPSRALRRRPADRVRSAARGDGRRRPPDQPRDATRR